MREHYPAPLVNTILVAADIPSRPIAYNSSMTSDTAYVMWQVIRALPNAVIRLFGRK